MWRGVATVYVLPPAETAVGTTETAVTAAEHSRIPSVPRMPAAGYQNVPFAGPRALPKGNGAARGQGRAVA